MAGDSPCFSNITLASEFIGVRVPRDQVRHGAASDADQLAQSDWRAKAHGRSRRSPGL